MQIYVASRYCSYIVSNNVLMPLPLILRSLDGDGMVEISVDN